MKNLCVLDVVVQQDDKNVKYCDMCNSVESSKVWEDVITHFNGVTNVMMRVVELIMAASR